MRRRGCTHPLLQQLHQPKQPHWNPATIMTPSDLFPMPTLSRRNGTLTLETTPLTAIAESYGTPCYVYSEAAIRAAWAAYREGLPPEAGTIHYAVKANSNLSILRLFAELGAGFDIVSGGELERVVAAGGKPETVVFSGVGKAVWEIERALELGIGAFHVESLPELERIATIAQAHGVTAPISFRVNPDVDPKTHPYIATGLARSKFGVTLDEARIGYRQAMDHPALSVVGVACHIGSQLIDDAPLIEAAERIRRFVEELADEGIRLTTIDLGGGIGIRYRDESPLDVAQTLRRLRAVFAGRPERLAVEPGRSLVGAAGLLLTRVEYVKIRDDHTFFVVDAAMNDLMRPALYEAWHEIVPVVDRPECLPRTGDVVGPVCETGDFLGLGRTLAVAVGDLLAVLCAGAYGMTMSSNYNTRPRAAEVLVRDSSHQLIRPREKREQLWADEFALLPNA